MQTRLICFDLDDTLIREIHSVMLPCILNGKEKKHSIIQEKEETGVLDYVSADYLRAKLLEGLDEDKVKVDCLDNFCHKNRINASCCIAVGDGSTDIPIFEYCGKSIAINASNKVKNKATYSIDTDNLLDILGYIKCD